MFYLRYLCLFAHSDVQYMLLFCFVCLRLVYPMLLVSLAGPFLIAPSIFSNVYFGKMLYNWVDVYTLNFV